MPSNTVFLDTSGWIAILNKDDLFHVVAVDLLRDFKTSGIRLLTTDWVVAETGNGLARTAARLHFPAAVKGFSQSPSAQVIRIDGETFERALELYEQAADKTWGLVDCASFIVMRGQAMTEALSADHHFEQAGFRCLLPTRSKA